MKKKHSPRRKEKKSGSEAVERRKLAQDRRLEGRRTEEQRIYLQSLLDSVSHPIAVVNKSRRLQFINEAFKRLNHREQWSPGEEVECHRFLYGRKKPCQEMGYPCLLQEILASGRPLTVEQPHVDSSGKTRHLEITGSPFQDEEGGLIGIIESFRDITDQKKAEENSQRDHNKLEHQVVDRATELVAANEALQREIEERKWTETELIKAKEEAELIYRVIPSAIFTVDKDQRITSWNDKAQEITGYYEEEVVGKKCDIFALKPCTVLCGVFSYRAQKPIMGKKCEIRTKDGRIRVVSKNADLLHDASGRVIGGIESFEDITVRNQMEFLLRTELDKFRSMLSTLGQGMHILNLDHHIEYQNEVLIEHFGDKIGRKCYAVYKQQDEPCENCKMNEAIKTGEIQRAELLMANGRYYEQSYAPFRDVDRQSKVLILLRDITEEKNFQAETMRAGQLAAIGELAAGVAHEINNPINGIINYAQLLLDENTASGSDSDVLDRLIREGERISDIIKNLLSFARQDDAEINEVAIDSVLDDSMALIKHQFLKDGIQVAVNLDTNLPTVQANGRQLQQVFLNLLNNARFALNQRFPDRNPDKRIEIGNKLIKLEKQPYVRISITDYGTGIPEEIIDHIFKPFYSMKKPGEGTGLGLSISHSFVKDFNGFLWVDSKVAQHTTMMVDLPTIINKGASLPPEQ